MERYDDLQTQIEPMLQQFVFPELSSPNGIMRCRAIDLYGQYITNCKEPDHSKMILENVF